MKRVKSIVLGVMLLGAAMLLAVPGRESDGIPSDRLVLRYWSYWTGREAEQMQEIINDFNKTVGAEKKLWVQYISMSQADQKTLIATAAGVPPEIAGLWGDQIAQFASMDALEPLETMAAEHGITKEYYKPIYWKACSYDGHLYGLAATPFAIGLYWNKEIFAAKADKLRAAGLDPDRPPRTLDELDRYAQALEEWKDGKLVTAGYFDQQPGWWLEHVYDWFGGRIYDEQTGKLTLTDPKVVQAYEWLRSSSLRIGVDEVKRFSSGLPAADNFGTPLNPFMSGAIAMMKQGPWFANEMDKHKPEMNRWKMSKEEEMKLPREQRKANYKWGAAPFPSAVPGQENAGYAGIDLLVIPRTAQHKKEAFEFIAFVNRQDNMERLCSMHCKNSPLAKMSEQYLETHGNPYIEVFETLAASPNINNIPPVPTWPQIRAELRNIGGNMLLNKGTAIEALTEAQDRLQAQLDDFNARQQRRESEHLRN